MRPKMPCAWDFLFAKSIWNASGRFVLLFVSPIETCPWEADFRLICPSEAGNLIIGRPLGSLGLRYFARCPRSCARLLARSPHFAGSRIMSRSWSPGSEASPADGIMRYACILAPKGQESLFLVARRVVINVICLCSTKISTCIWSSFRAAKSK